MAKKTPPRSAKKTATTPKKAAAKKPTKKATATKKTTAKKTPVKKAPTQKAPAKKAPAKKKASGKTTKSLPAKKSVKKAVAKKAPVKKTAPKKAAAKKAPAKKPAAKPAAKKAPAKKVAVKKAPTKKAAPAKASGTKSVSSVKKTAKAPKTSPATKATPAKAASKSKSTSVSSTGKSKPATKKAAARDALRSRVLGRSKGPKSIAFSLDEVQEIAKTSAKREVEDASKKAKKSAEKKAAIEASLKAAKPTHVAAASLADILGFNPAGGKKATYDDPSQVPDKFRRYYKALLELREALTGQIDQHSEETLKRSSKDDAGDLSSYGQHMADAGTDTFDRDFALSLVANEQEALSEIEAAIQRIKKGTYGVCEVTGKPIPKDRLMAVPFTRYTAEAQKQLERNRHRVRTQAGLFGEMGEDGPTLSDTSDDD